MSLAQATAVSVDAAGEFVVVMLGPLKIAVRFEDALSWSAEILACARVAGIPKGRQGARVAGVLTDAAAEKSPPPVKLPPIIARAKLGADCVGSLISMRIGDVTATLNAEAAAQIAQWLRIRGKQARNYAGEHANWADIGDAKRVMNNTADRILH